ncbi:acylneuraminate cytidylyltransferase family protein [Nitrosomonas eutropha]|uniref:N-acylneuraminate cytidylyltransferase n=2 Tax=Nitrosomonas eutropha TaxID=916 RepID=A0ABX5MBB9_9PROT|nr:acylneuraminate cytidylyltransferase family protein [Nitrosomonas eutropha]ABI59792.1 N-acylneuraminate cytidylyltransferase [Nitrosomonas eutropha C91]PXV83619.1 N-acylneuraminate cytidylyltransferase [Nitrosomonas eutropha]SEI57856.1 N-acylneuraminate cytidylyltransferase [Nitrosomonas eutropha]
MLIYSLIPARGGSKAVPHKNIRFLCGKPLIAHSIEVSLRSPSIQRTFVSTDSKKIAEIARNAGAEVPFLRPVDLAQDDTRDLPVFLHFLSWLEQRHVPLPDAIFQFRPTSPARRVEKIEEAVGLLKKHPDADSVRGVTEPAQNPYKMWTIGNDGFMQALLSIPGVPEPFNEPRQRLPEVYWQVGYLDLIRTRTILEKQSLTGAHILPLKIESGDSIDIDDEFSFQLAEFLMEKRGIIR